MKKEAGHLAGPAYFDLIYYAVLFFLQFGYHYLAV